MKVAEALILRADRQKRLEQLKQRLVRSAKVQEGDNPPEDPKALIAELEHVTEELTSLIQRINRTNSVTALKDGMLMSDALALRDVLAKKQAIYRDLAHAAVVTQDRYSKSEVRFRSTVSVADIQRQADDLAKQYRELDARIQEANWVAELTD